jgi:hypothetical protein
METPEDTPAGWRGGLSPRRKPETALTIAAHADHRREDFVFPRTQSRTTRDMAWERRLPPLPRSLLTRAANAAADIVARLA